MKQHPSAITSALKVGWHKRVRSALDPNSIEMQFRRNDYTFSCAELEIDKNVSREKRRIEFRILCKSQPFFRLLLDARVEDTNPNAETKRMPFTKLAVDLVEQLQENNKIAHVKYSEHCQQVTMLNTSLNEKLTHIHERARRKARMEEGLLAALKKLVDNKQQELLRLQKESTTLETEVESYSKQLQFLSSDRGMRLKGEHMEEDGEVDLRKLAKPLVSDGEDDGGSGKEEEDEGAASEPETKKKVPKRKGARGGVKAEASDSEEPPAAASSSASRGRKTAAAPKPRAPPKSKKSPAAAAKNAAPKKSKQRKRKYDSSEDESSDEEEEYVEEEDDEDDAPKRRGKKRFRSPSPIAEAAAEEEDDEDEEDSEVAKAIAQVQAYETKAAEEERKRQPQRRGSPLPTPIVARTDSTASASKRVTRASSSASHGSSSEHPSLPSLHQQQPAEEESSNSQEVPAAKKRRSSPPPKKLPTRSLAEILRAGAAGFDSQDQSGTSNNESSPHPANNSQSQQPVAPVAAAGTPMPRRSTSNTRASGSQGPVPMVMSSQ